MKSNHWTGKKYRLHYYTCGDPAHPPVILLHGFLGTGLDWLEIIHTLADDFYCVAPDLPGHGKTRVKGYISNYTMEVFSSECIHFLKQNNLHSPVLLGYSMGGRIALHMAMHNPHSFSRLVLESSSPGLKTARERQQRMAHDEALAIKMETININEFLAEWYVQPIFSSLKENKGFQVMLERRMEVDRLEAAKALRMLSTGRQEPLWERLASFNVPLLLLAGELDLKFSKIMAEMSGLVPEATFTIIKDAGHNVHIEQPAPFVTTVKQFLNRPGDVTDVNNKVD